MAFNFDWNRVSPSPEFQSFMQGFLSSETQDSTPTAVLGISSNAEDFQPHMVPVDDKSGDWLLLARKNAPNEPYKVFLRSQDKRYMDLNGNPLPQNEWNDDNVRLLHAFPENTDLVTAPPKGYTGKFEPYIVDDEARRRYSIDQWLDKFPGNPTMPKIQPKAISTDNNSAGNPALTDDGWPAGYNLRARTNSDALDPRDDSPLYWADQNGIRYNTKFQPLPQELQNDNGSYNVPLPPKGWDIGEENSKVFYIDPNGRRQGGFARELPRG